LTPALSIEDIETYSPTNPSIYIDLINYNSDNYLAAGLNPSKSKITTNIEIKNPIHINLTNKINPQLLSYLINSTIFISLITLAYSPKKEGTYLLKDRSFIKDKDPTNNILK
jgi:hypothetical protein